MTKETQQPTGLTSHLTQELGTLTYNDDNWAHKALLEMDEALPLVEFCSVNMSDHEKHTKASEAFWRAAKMLARERERIHFDYECEDCIGIGKEHGCYCQANGASKAGG